jgi:CMD domain protein
MNDVWLVAVIARPPQEEMLVIDPGFDIINQLAGIADDSPLGKLRASRDTAFTAAQGSFKALLEPDDFGGVSRIEREAIAYRVALLEQSTPVIDLHNTRLQEAGATAEQIEAIADYPEVGNLPERLETILGHVDLLTLEPKAASPEALTALNAAGLSTRDIITVSQLIAFVSFQVRLLATLRVMKEPQA